MEVTIGLLKESSDMSHQLTTTKAKRQPSKKMATVWLCLSGTFTRAGAFSRAPFVRSLVSKQAAIPTGRRTWTDKVELPSRRWRHMSLAMSGSSPVETKSSSEYDLENKKKGLASYAPAEFEQEIYSWWEGSGCFDPDAKMQEPETNKKPYVLPMPPPNVTGRLHMGHAIFVALQDVLARFHRMRGRPVLWLPGRYRKSAERSIIFAIV